jgi:hypothetical protein
MICEDNGEERTREGKGGIQINDIMEEETHNNFDLE